jgi:uncharacterized surface protein with fasciclin (FAS1) repeats
MDTIIVDNANIAGAKMAASNGIVHVIETVLLPPTVTNPATARPRH